MIHTIICNSLTNLDLDILYAPALTFDKLKIYYCCKEEIYDASLLFFIIAKSIMNFIPEKDKIKSYQ